MTDSEKLRFELGEGFKVLDKDKLLNIEDMFIALNDCNYILGYLLFKDPEIFVQVLSKLGSEENKLALTAMYEIYNDLDLLSYSIKYLSSNNSFWNLNSDFKVDLFWIRSAYRITEKYMRNSLSYDDQLNYTSCIQAILFLEKFLNL